MDDGKIWLDDLCCNNFAYLMYSCYEIEFRNKNNKLCTFYN